MWLLSVLTRDPFGSSHRRFGPTPQFLEDLLPSDLDSKLIRPQPTYRLPLLTFLKVRVRPVFVSRILTYCVSLTVYHLEGPYLPCTPSSLSYPLPTPTLIPFVRRKWHKEEKKGEPTTRKDLLTKNPRLSRERRDPKTETFVVRFLWSVYFLLLDLIIDLSTTVGTSVSRQYFTRPLVPKRTLTGLGG